MNGVVNSQFTPQSTIYLLKGLEIDAMNNTFWGAFDTPENQFSFFMDNYDHIEFNDYTYQRKDGTVVVPKSTSILPSITRRSLVYVASEYLGLKVDEREVYFDEVKDFAEAGLCGTAAVISPVGKIVDHGKEICLPSGMNEMGPTIKKLYDTLTGIQMGRIEAPEGWIKVVE